MRRTMFTLLTAALLAAISPLALGEDWPNWRGPNHNGSSKETNLPVKFSKTENVAWAIDLPGVGPSTPVVVGDIIFVSVATPEHQMMALAYDRKSGKQLWADTVAVAPPGDNRSNKAGPSAAADDKHVLFFFGSGDLACYTHDGKQVWKRQICEEYGDFAFMWTFSSSPTLHKGVAYLPILQNTRPYRQGKYKPGKDSFILAFDPGTGKNIWKVDRPSAAVAESLEAFTTIVPHTNNGKEELLVTGGDCLTGHDPKTGAELWRWGTWNPTKIGHWRLVPSPVAGGGVALACAPKGDPVYAIKLGGSGDISEGGLAWKSKGGNISSDVSTPLFYMDKFFVLNSDRRAMVCVEPKDGSVVWEIDKLPGRAKYEASPTGADGKIYTISHKGEADVIDAKTGTVLHSTDMGGAGVDNNRPTIVVAGGNLIIKVHNKLYCIGGGKVN